MREAKGKEVRDLSLDRRFGDSRSVETRRTTEKAKGSLVVAANARRLADKIRVRNRGVPGCGNIRPPAFYRRYPPLSSPSPHFSLAKAF